MDPHSQRLTEHTWSDSNAGWFSVRTDEMHLCRLVCVVGYKSHPHLWSVKLTATTAEASHDGLCCLSVCLYYYNATIFWLYQKTNNQQVISPLKKNYT